MSDSRESYNAPSNEETDLRSISIEIVGRDALVVAASLKLGGLGRKAVRRAALVGRRDSEIMKDALNKLGKRNG